MGATMTVISLVAAAASAAASAVGSIQQSKVAAQNAQYEARMAKIRGSLAETAARQDALDVTEAERKTRAAQVAQASAAGVTVDSDSVFNLMTETSTKAEKERTDLLRAGAISKAASEAQASASRTAAENYKTAGVFSATSSLLTGTAQSTTIADKAGWFN